MTRSRLLVSTLIWVGLGSLATAQDLPGTTPAAPAPAEDEGQIDLTPLLDTAPAATPEDAAPAAPAPDPEPAPAPEDTDAADTTTGDGPASLPLYQRGGAEAAGSEAAPDTAAPQAGPQQLFYPARSTAGPAIQRLSGEYDELQLVVTVPPGATADSFVITYRNSINILEDDSRIIVLRDDVEIASWAPGAPGDFVTQELPVASLQPGDNLITIRTEQSHRIFCGPEASFAIWTDIDPSRSGVALQIPAGTAPDLAAFRLAAQAQLATGSALPLVTTLPLDAARLRDLDQRLTGLAPGARLALQDPYALPGTVAPLARIALLPGTLDAAGPTAPRFLRTPDGGVVMVLSDATPAATLDALLPRGGEIAGPPAVTPGTATPLQALSDTTLAMRSRYARRSIPFQLPADWLMLSSQQARIDLLYQYAGGLPDGSLLLLKVNETTVRLLPLFGQGDTELPLLPVGFPARLLQPGMNAISFEAIIPGAPPDLPCPRIEGPFLRISDASTLTVPPTPRMQYPAVAPGLLALTPDAITLVPDLAGNPRGEAMQTALTLGLPPVTGAGMAAAETTAGAPRLTISTLGTLDQVPLAPMGLDRLALERVLTPARATGPATATTGADAPDQAPGAALGADRASYAADAGSWLQTSWDRLRRMAWPGDPDLARWIADRDGIALLVMPDPAVPQDMWLIAGPTADPATLTTALAEGRLSASGPTGQAALLSDGGTWQNWRPAAMPPQLVDRLSLRNIRAVAGNYASWSPALFVGILALLMSVSVILGLRFVVTTRGARKR